LLHLFTFNKVPALLNAPNLEPVALVVVVLRVDVAIRIEVQVVCVTTILRRRPVVGVRPSIVDRRTVSVAAVNPTPRIVITTLVALASFS
jgi:hypothetical protein